MLSSKANAALTRLKEIEEKYKIKRKEEIWKCKEDSSISSISIDPSDNFSAKPKDSSKNVSKARLDIKMPNARIEEPLEDTEVPSDGKETTFGSAGSKSLGYVDEVNLDVAVPLEDKSPRPMEKQESFISDVTTIHENSSIESVLDDSMTSSKSLLRAKKLQLVRINESSKHDISGVREEKAKTRSKLRKEKEPDKSSENSLKKLSRSSDGSSTIKSSRLSRESNGKIMKSLSDLKTSAHAIKEEEIVKTSEIVRFSRDLNTPNRSVSKHDDSVTDESIGTMKDGSEIISELSRAEERIVDKAEYVSVNASGNPKYPVTENLSTYISNNLECSVAGNTYANNTFEDVSSSTIRSKSESRNEKMMEEKRKIDNNAECSMGKINIVPHEECYRNSVGNHRDGQVVEHVAPKARINTSDCEISLDKELSNYANNSKSIETDPNKMASIRLLKTPKSVSTRSKRQKNCYKHRTGSSEENARNAVDTEKNILDSSIIFTSAESSTGDVTKIDESAAIVRRECSRRKSSPEIRMTSVSSRQESAGKECGKVSDGTRERAMINVSGLPVADGEERIESAKSNLSKEENEKGKEDDNVLGPSSHRLISESAEDVTSMLRKLRRDAIDAMTKRYGISLKTTEGPVSESSSGNNHNQGTISKKKVQDVTTTSKKTVAKREDETGHSTRKNESDGNIREHISNRRKCRTEIINSMLDEARKCSGNRNENEALKHDKKQIHRFRKKIVELRLRQERRNLEEHIHKLKNSRLGSSCTTQDYFSPLEFPKIAEFTRHDADIRSKKDDQHIVLHERISAIRQWLKDQYILYRDYSTIAQAINAQYVPTTLQDTRKTIRELQKMIIKTR